jgi:UDP-N-acetylglucosamine pyrophosphorylase
MSQHLQCTLKAVEKTDPEEKLGIIGVDQGVYKVIPYDDITAEMKAEYDENGYLKHIFGDILVFMMSTEFLIHLCTANQQ